MSPILKQHQRPRFAALIRTTQAPSPLQPFLHCSEIQRYSTLKFHVLSLAARNWQQLKLLCHEWYLKGLKSYFIFNWKQWVNFKSSEKNITMPAATSQNDGCLQTSYQNSPFNLLMDVCVKRKLNNWLSSIWVRKQPFSRHCPTLQSTFCH